MKYLNKLTLFAIVALLAIGANAQSELAPNQNPNFAVSRAKYMNISDSLNRWHGTTPQETYKAIDFLVDRKEARAERRDFRRQLRSQRVGWYNSYDNYSYYPSSYRNSWGNQNYNYNNYGRYRRNNSFYVNPWGLGYWWR